MNVRQHVRCKQCETRRCLPRLLDQYEPHQVPQCRVCGKRKYRVDKWMNTRDTTVTRCAHPNCSGYPFPHRRGSLYCWTRKDGSDRYPGDPDFADRNYFPEDIATPIAA